MKTYIILLRGINVGGHRKIPMAELRELLINHNFKNVKTYIQSGNVVFQSAIDSNRNIEEKIYELIKNHFEFEITVLVKTHAELEIIFNKSPFREEKLEKSYFMILDSQPDITVVDELSKLSCEDEEFQITDNCIYFFSANGYGRTKFNSNFFERKLKVNATARNHKTMLKLLAIAKETESTE